MNKHTPPHETAFRTTFWLLLLL